MPLVLQLVLVVRKILNLQAEGIISHYVAKIYRELGERGPCLAGQWGATRLCTPPLSPEWAAADQLNCCKELSATGRCIEYESSEISISFSTALWPHVLLS